MNVGNEIVSQILMLYRTENRNQKSLQGEGLTLNLPGWKLSRAAGEEDLCEPLLMQR